MCVCVCVCVCVRVCVFVCLMRLKGRLMIFLLRYVCGCVYMCTQDELELARDQIK